MKNFKTTATRALATLAAITALCASTAALAAQTTFASPAAAADALVAALKAHDRKTTLAILGNSAEPWLWSGDAVADRNAGEHFVAQFDAKHAIVADGDKSILTVGDDGWPFAFPLVQANGQWHFDTAAGKEELLARRIGGNELDVINVMLAIVDAQRDYASAAHDATGLPQYARKFASSPGKKDGLYWPTAVGETASPLGSLVVRASNEGYGKDKTKPYHGYYFRMLERQGKDAPGGAQDYIVHGRMIGGFAAIAWPAQYKNSGVMTFIVNQDGVVYQKDLGPDTAKRAAAITSFDPSGWEAVKPK
ncbi:MAG: DUF2950 domain-containing protein [Proteobacteria bacterium]|nr:DUF2950 domain-containing protein [Pseudomonadota bacterium]